jgi:pimeloyl-ACP methyl ester carboxylesterase
MVDEHPEPREDSRSTRRADVPLQVVLVHGAPDRARSFNATVRELTGYAVTTYDRRGYGQRAGHQPLPSGDIFEHADDLIAVLGGRPGAVVGHSFGAIVAMAASIKAPHLITALGLWEPPLVWTSWWPDNRMRRATEKLVASTDLVMLGELYTRTAMGEAVWQALPSARRASYRAEGAALHADMRSILSEPYSLASLAAPILVGCGSGGNQGYDDVARRLASFLSAELFELPGAPHMVHVAQPEAFAHFVIRAAALGSPGLSTDRSP